MNDDDDELLIKLCVCVLARNTARIEMVERNKRARSERERERRREKRAERIKTLHALQNILFVNVYEFPLDEVPYLLFCIL